MLVACGKACKCRGEAGEGDDTGSNFRRHYDCEERMGWTVRRSWQDGLYL
jgi:hypothetical protein